MADRRTIEAQLIHGGMATVYLVENLKHDRRVAIKVLCPKLAAGLGAEPFVQEIKTDLSGVSFGPPRWCVAGAGHGPRRRNGNVI